jgi:hypothetical protein
MRPIPLINRTLILAAAPFFGAMLFLLIFSFRVELPELERKLDAPFTLQNELAQASTKLDSMKADAALTRTIIEKYYETYEKSSSEASGMLVAADAAMKRPSVIFDNRFASRLGGKVTRAASSSNVDLKLYTFDETRYKGYALKVELKSDKGMRMTLGKDVVGGSETTLEAARRYGAVAGVNAGGFADDPKSGKRYPLSNTVLNGKFVYGFFPSAENLTFVGLGADRKLIGGTFQRQDELDRLKPVFGATFVPTLLLGGKKQPIPAQWQTSPARAARTVVGSFKNDQLLFLVTDGYDEKGNSGATLAELQDKLLALGVKDAYNLDGGGSSTLVFDGQVINHPSDGRMRPLPTHFLFFK